MKEADRADLDYDDLTVSEGEFSDEESKKFAAFLKEKRAEIKRNNEVGDRLYDETYQSVAEDEQRHPYEQFEELERKIEELKPDYQKAKDKILREQVEDEYAKYMRMSDLEQKQKITQFDLEFFNQEQQDDAFLDHQKQRRRD